MDVHCPASTQWAVFAQQDVGLPTAPFISETHDSTSVSIAVTEPADWGTGSGKSYTLQENTGADGYPWPIETVVSYPTTTIDKTGLTPSSTHWYRLGAVTTKGTRWSNELKVTLDAAPKWGAAGIVLTDFGGTTGRALCSAIQSDGKVLIAGNVNNGGNVWAIKRLNTNGTVDTSFGTSGLVTIDWGHASPAKAIALQDDGKILVAGGSGDFEVARLDTDGALDIAGFNSGGGTPGTNNLSVADGGASAGSIIIQASGKIVLSGKATVTADSQTEFALIRLLTDGTLDSAFGSSGLTTTKIGTGVTNCLSKAQSTGKIIAGGTVAIAGVHYFAVARYSVDGVLDTSFGTSGITTTNFEGTPSNDFFNGLAIQSDDKVVAVGQVTIGATYQVGLARFTAAGILDTAFNTAGQLSIGYLTNDDVEGNCVAIDGSGNIVVGGTTATDTPSDSYYSFLAARVTTGGAVDSTFGTSGLVVQLVGGYTGGSYDLAYSINIQADGKILLVGESDTDTGSQTGTLRLLDDGSLDA